MLRSTLEDLPYQRDSLSVQTKDDAAKRLTILLNVEVDLSNVLL